jgi:broad specificity phosphatase PhoE
VATLALFGCSPEPDAVAPGPATEPLLVFVVRHAERTDQSEDAPLSAAGRERAEALASALRSAHLDHVYSSDYARTKETAAPVATGRGLQVELYDPRNLPALADKLRETGGRHLVVGHSNTTPTLVELLGGEPGSPIDDAGEFDRLYIVAIGRNGSTSSVMLRFGEPYDPRLTR